jgi:hypothetical protein
MPHSKKVLCIPNSSDISLNSKANPFTETFFLYLFFLNTGLLPPNLLTEREMHKKGVKCIEVCKAGSKKCILFPKSSNVTY